MNKHMGDVQMDEIGLGEHHGGLRRVCRDSRIFSWVYVSKRQIALEGVSLSNLEGFFWYKYMRKILLNYSVRNTPLISFSATYTKSDDTDMMIHWSITTQYVRLVQDLTDTYSGSISALHSLISEYSSFELSIIWVPFIDNLCLINVNTVSQFDQWNEFSSGLIHKLFLYSSVSASYFFLPSVHVHHFFSSEIWCIQSMMKYTKQNFLQKRGGILYIKNQWWRI